MLFSTWELNTNLVLTVALIKVGQYYVEFLVFSTKDGSFLSLSALSKKLKLKGKFSNNREKIICRLFHNFAQFLFTISERKLDYYGIIECLESMKYSAGHPKCKLWLFCYKILKNQL